MSLDDTDIALMQRIARESSLELTRGKLPVPVRRPGTVFSGAANGQVAQVIMDTDLADPDAGPALPLNTLGRSVTVGERVMVTFAEGAAWVTDSLAKMAGLPVRASDTANSSTTTTAYVDSLATVTFTQHVDGAPIFGLAKGHVDSTDATAVVEVSVRDGSDVVIVEYEWTVGSTVDQAFSFWWDEEPAAGALTRKLSLRRIGGAGTINFAASSVRPTEIRLDLADGLAAVVA